MESDVGVFINFSRLAGCFQGSSMWCIMYQDVIPFDDREISIVWLITFCLSIHQVMDIWIISAFWQS